MSFQQKGILHEIFDEQQVSEKFRKREFVLEIAGQYPEHVKFQLTQDKCALVDGYRFGDEVNVHFTLRGRGFNKNGQMMYFTNLEAWKVEASGNTPQPAARPQQKAPQPAPAPMTANSTAPIADGGDNDLPF